MYNQDLIFRAWKTSFKYIQNQGWGKPSLRPGVLIFCWKVSLWVCGLAWWEEREVATDFPGSGEAESLGNAFF